MVPVILAVTEDGGAGKFVRIGGIDISSRTVCCEIDFLVGYRSKNEGDLSGRRLANRIDIIEVEAENIGVLRNGVIDETTTSTG